MAVSAPFGPPSSMIVSLFEVSVQSRTSMEKKGIYGGDVGWVERQRNPSWALRLGDGLRPGRAGLQPILRTGDICGEKVIYGGMKKQPMTGSFACPRAYRKGDINDEKGHLCAPTPEKNRSINWLL